MKTQIKDIELVYSEKQEGQLNDIKSIINNNYELIYGCLVKNKIIDISEGKPTFDIFFKYIVYIEFFKNENNNRFLSDEDFLIKLYSTILRRIFKYDNSYIVPNLEVGVELLTTFIAYKYFESSGDFDSLVNYLKVRDREEKLFQWLQSVSRWPTYNYILKSIVDNFKLTDEDFSNRFDKVISIFYNRLKDNDQQNTTNNDYPIISNEEFDTLFYEFLKYINSPDEWVDIYNNLKEKGLIINAEINDGSVCFLDDDGIVKIKINNKDNIKGFINFVHEFIHYISLMNLSIDEIDKMTNSVVSEFPSRFFEIIACEFLEEKGYPDGIVDKNIKDNEISFFNTINDIISLLNDISAYIKYDKVDKEESETLLREDYKDKTESEISEIADGFCDQKICYYLENGFDTAKIYVYLICTYLVEQVLKKRKDDNSIIEKMIYATTNLKNLKVDDILTLFGIENAFDEETIKKVLKKDLSTV